MRRLSIPSSIREYSLSIAPNAFEEVSRLIAERPCYILADSKVCDIYRDFFTSLSKSSIVFEVAASEREKEYAAVSKWIQRLIDKGFRRNHTLITIGGGVLQDLSGFIAATLYRGVQWVYVPTTLLSQADSCIGSKVSINLGEKKNTLGLFYPPHHIYLDVDLLSSLPPSEFSSGVGEIIKFNLMAPAGSANVREVSNRLSQDSISNAELEEIIYDCLCIKRAYFESDEFDKGRRNLCNYGHCFGHALESASAFSIPHGQAVLVGILVADRVAEARGLITKKTREYNRACISSFMPEPSKLRDIQITDVTYYMRWDKKRIGSKLSAVLYEGQGQLSLYQDITDLEITEAATKVWDTL